MSSWHWNTLYPSDEKVGSLEDAAREAEWKDDMRGWRKKHTVLDEEDDGWDIDD